MPKLGDLLPKPIIQAARNTSIAPGVILHGPMEGVDHGKFYIIAGMSGDKCCVCSVIINSEINQFILKRPKLLNRQLEILKKDYQFLKYDSFINCAQPLKSSVTPFKESSFTYKDTLSDQDLSNVIEQIKLSGTLTEDEMDLYFPK